MDERRNVLKVASFEEREWIDPWRDRRPMTDDEVLVTAYDWYKNHLITTTAWYRTTAPDLDSWNVILPRYGWSIPNVLYWMPMPEPYNPAEEE